MKLFVMSDSHLGFGSGTERWEDAFLTFEEGIEKGLETDLILMAGDVFDTRVPTAETFSRAMETLLMTQSASSAVTVAETVEKVLITPPQGIPVVAIHGNHERRVKGLVNPVQALEKGGFLIHLHANAVVFRKGQQDRVAIHGLSAVPPQYALPALQEWSPSPVQGAYNILVIHQNLEGFVRSDDTIPRESLPRGFDLVICGDIHEHHKTTVHGKPLLLPGSTVATQITKDACNPRRYTLVDTCTGDIQSAPFRNQRKIYYDECGGSEAGKMVSAAIQETHLFKPIIKIKSPDPLDEVKAQFSEDALLMLDTARNVPAVTREERVLSVRQSGQALLREHMKNLGLDTATFEDVFELLVNKKSDEALSRLRQKEKGDT